MSSRARTARVVTSAATNPRFTLLQLGGHFTYGETAAYQFVLGQWDLDAEDPKNRLRTPKEFVHCLFGMFHLRLPDGSKAADLVMYCVVNERLPYNLGWKTPENRLDMDTLQNMVYTIQDITLGQMNEK
jgi:hypothetical protein